MTTNEELVDAAEMHQEKRVCGNPSHTNPEVGCPDCQATCQWCDDEWPCLPRRLADRLAALTTPQEGDARERLAFFLHDWSNLHEPLATELAKHRANILMAAFPVLSRDIAGEIEAGIAEYCSNPGDEWTKGFREGLEAAAEIVRNGR